jgi:dienelactone hydrolase
MTARPSHLRGAIDAAAAALDGGLRTIAGVHTAIARKPFAALRLVPGIGEASEPVRLVHDGVTALVYGGISGALALAGGAARLAAVSAPADSEPPAASLAGTAVAALNGFAGDRLEREGNPLAAMMSLRHRGRLLAPRREALAAVFPAASPRVVLFVHGLACNETAWWRHAGRHYGDPDVSYGSRLDRDLGFTALYLRYNSGLPIAENGRRLAQLLDEAVAEWPVPVAELVLVGHSMGGLVLRGAARHGAARPWVRCVRHVFYLGSPHRGAPLEKGANAVAWLLACFEVTRPFAEVLNGRSRGIKDLRYGTLRDEDWQGAEALPDDRTADVPLLEGANHHFIAATVTRDRRHPLGIAAGDLLVRPASAFGCARQAQFPLAHTRHFGAMTHLDLLNHPDVYEQLRHALSDVDPALEGSAPGEP